MDDLRETQPQSPENKNSLPDVVHSQESPAVGNAAALETEALQTDSNKNIESEISNQNVADASETESISEHIPSKIDYSTESEQIVKNEAEETSENQEKVAKASLSIPQVSQISDNPSQASACWLESPADDHPISKESPVNLALSDSKEDSLALAESEEKSLSPQEAATPVQSESPEPSDETQKQSLSEYLDSLNEEQSISIGAASMDSNLSNVDKSKSSSEEIIKLDIRGQGALKFPLPTAKIIFGPPPEGSNILDSIEPIPVFPNLLSPFLVGAGDIKVEDVFDFDNESKDYDPEDRDPSLFQSKEATPDQIEFHDQSQFPYQIIHFPDDTAHLPAELADLSDELAQFTHSPQYPQQIPQFDPAKDQDSDKSLLSDKEQDVLIEEVTVDHDTKPKDTSMPTPKSIPDDTVSLTTMTTDYKTICEDYQIKLVHFEEALSKRDELIEELTHSLQKSVQERDDLQAENSHLTQQVHNLQHIVAETDSETKGQLSDFVKYENMIKDDSTKFYSAVMSDGSSNGEKDMDREEITVSYSRSDVKSSDGSMDDFQTGFELKLTSIIDKFDEFIEENLRNKLRESIIQVLCTEIGKMRLEYDTEIKDLESQLQQDKHSHTLETRRLRELLSSIRAGHADIDTLREEMRRAHESEMESLRTYFERKCTDMERSYSEDVYRGRTCVSPSVSGDGDACGDGISRRTRSADVNVQEYSVEQALKQANKKHEQQLEELKSSHLIYITELEASHRDIVAALQQQITDLKTRIQTAENTETNVSVSMYQQDIDLELEKKAVEEKLQEVRQEVVHELQEQIKVLLSDPDAEVSSWPQELVALRDKIHQDARQQDKQPCGREELCGEADKWKQRRNYSFDQNRQLEQVTKERDGLRRVAVSLHTAVSQLVAYCACAERELNDTVLKSLLSCLHHDTSTIDLEDSRPSTPNLSFDLNTSVSRSSKHVHFAPDLQSILAELDEDGLVGFLQEQRDLSADIKKELENSLKRLRNEAHELLDLSTKLSTKCVASNNMLEAPATVQITELVERIDNKDSCEHCDLHKKTMEEAMRECLQREALLRADLDAAMMRIASLMTDREQDTGTGTEIVEGYGCMGPLPARRRAPQSLDGLVSPRAHLAALSHDMDAIVRERDDLQQQLEAANRQLRSTRQFVEEQATERESERDEFARRLADLREENQRLSARLQTNARILSEVEQLETQTREMTQIISELESRKASTDDQLKSYDEKVALLRDIISNLENQLEQKTKHENEVLKQLEVMKQTIDERDDKMRCVLGELESLRIERADSSDVMCVKCANEEDKYAELMEKIKEQCVHLEELLSARTRRLERLHETCSAPCSEPSEDVSKRDQRNTLEPRSPSDALSPRVEWLPQLESVYECARSLWRTEDAAVKRIHDLEMQRDQLKHVAQEVRAERDVLQARMSEQALKISSLSARLQRERCDADALKHEAHSQLSVRLHDTTAQVQRLREELESKDKQLLRLRQTIEERDKIAEKQYTLYGNTCNPKDKVVILERELCTAQSRIAQLEGLARSLESDKDSLQSALRQHQRALAEKEAQLNELLALKLDDENQKEEKSDILDGGKTSARTLSDIVSISEYDEQDLQMRRAELKTNFNLTGAPFDTNKTENDTPEVQRPNMSSLNIDFGDHFDIDNSPRADSLPAHLTSTQNKDIFKEFKRNINETTVFGIGDSLKHSTAQKIPDNCSLYPNRDVSDSKHNSVEPKKIDFSLEPSNNNKTHDITSLKELGITIDVKQENFPDIFAQLKHEVKKARNELEMCKTELKNAEEQLCEFPALKEEVEELKGLLENTMATMENDKKFYENQLENFTSNKKLLEQRLTELTQEVNDKSKDLHLLKEDILRRENMILELAKEKRNLTNKMTELEVKIDELQNRNNMLEKYEAENPQLREQLSELQRLQQLLSDKNHQIDSLNQHLDRLDDMQRRLSDKNDEMETLKEAFEEKSNELFRLQDVVESMNQNVAQINAENQTLAESNKDLKLKLSKLEKEQENASLRLQNSESEVERVNALNNELTSKIDELKQLTDRLKDKETEIEILNEDINAFHEEIATLKEQLKLSSRSPSPRRKQDSDTQRARDTKHMARIRKQIALLQHELDFNKKELNDKAFELSKAKLDVTELKNNLGQVTKVVLDKDVACRELIQTNEALQAEVNGLKEEKLSMAQRLEAVVARIREEGNIGELKVKLKEKTERCLELESEVTDLKELIERLRETHVSNPEDQRALVVSGTRSPTAELERALRDQLDYSHTLDEDIMEQILSASSDEREDIPRLALNSSKSSSIHTSTSERLSRMRAENEKLSMQVTSLEARLRDKDALIAELNQIRDKLSSECQSASLQLAAAKDNASRLQLLLDTQKQTADTLQNQDSNMIGILKKRLEASMQSELELQQREQQARARAAQLERQLIADGHSTPQLTIELENKTRLEGEISLLKSRLELERTRCGDLQSLLENFKIRAQRDLDDKSEACNALRGDLADLKRQKHELSAELVRARELCRAQAAAIAQLENKVSQQPHYTELNTPKSALSRELSLKRLQGTVDPESTRGDQERLQARLQLLETAAEEKDQAIRYVHGRSLRLESCRKALVWQKRYLQRVIAGYERMEQQFRLTATLTHTKRRFKCVAVMVVSVLRMGFLVRRRHHVRAVSAHCLIRPTEGANTSLSSTPNLVSTSPPTRDRSSVAATRATLPRRLLPHDIARHLPNTVTASPQLPEFRRSPFVSHSPRDEPFMLSSPRGEVAAAYLSKLELVSRCLSHTMDTSRDVP